MANRKTEFTWDKLDAMLAFGPTADMCGELMDCSRDAIEVRIKKKYGLTFTQYRDRKMSATKMKLVQHALKQAFGGNTTMLIFCLKNICKWRDNPEEDPEDVKPFRLAYDPGPNVNNE